MIDMIKAFLADPNGRDLITLIGAILDKVFAFIKGEQNWA